MIPATLAVLTWALLLQLTEGGCPETRPTKQILCYLEHVTPHFDPCVCTHLVLQSTIDKLTPQSELLKSAKLLQEQNPSLKLVGVASDSAESALKRRDAFAKSVANVVNKCELDGVEVSLRWGAKVPGKVQLVDFIKSLSKEFKRLDPLQRSKRSYSIFEQTDDEESKPRWSPPQHREQKQRRTRESDDEPTVRRIKKTDDAATSPPEDISNEEKEGDKTNEAVTNRREIIVKLPADPQVLAKNYDLKRLSKYIDFYTLASDNFTDVSEEGLTFHPSRLMGIEDILNADSLVDLLTGLGAPHDKLVMAMPGTALKFTLADSKKNMPRSPTTGEPETISQSELCALMSEGTWTVERDEDLTAPYAFRKKTWIAFDDRISVSIKGKYILLRDLAGGAVASADAEDWSGKCNTTGIARTLYDTFTTIARKPREAQLVSLQEQLHESSQFSAYSGDIQLSPYRIVRVVDRQGAIHVVRKEAKTEFECSRQGYFRHPNGCNRFYRCVKFNQYSSDFTVFEYDCPAGLAFDERWEVCVWPGSLPDGGACQGSSEIAPVPRERFVCPRVEGYYADPENCRWFFACLDHIRDGVTALTAYEFRCPFGLVFNEKLLICDWPWLVEGCGGIGIFRARFTVGDFLEGRQRASYAQLSDVHVSGGRIENVNGGVVLGSLAGLGGAGSYASGSHILATGAAAADGYAGGAGGYGAGGLIAGYAGESGAAYSGAAGGHGVAGGYAGAGAGGAAGYVAGVGDGGVTYVSGVGAGGAHTGESTLLYTGGDKYAAGTGVYSPGTGGALLGAGKSVYAAGGLGVGVHGGQATLLSGGGEYSGVAAGYAGESGTAYTGTGGAGYVAGGAGAGKSTLLYSGKLAGSALGSGIGYAVGDDSGLYSAGGYEGGKSSLVYTTGGSAGHGLASGIAFGGTTLAVDHGADSVVTTAADADAYLNEAAGVAAFEANKFGGAAVVHQPVSSVSYHGSFGQKTAVPVTLVSDAISSGNGGFDAVHTVSKPAVVSNLYNVKVTPASDAIVTGLGGHLSSGYVSSTVAPVGVVTATPAPIPISTYTTPRPKTYYPVESIGFTPAPITTYHRPLASVTAAPITTYHRPLFSPTVTPTVDVDFKYQQPVVKTVTPVHPVAAVHYPTVLKTPVVPLNPVQYSTPAPAVSIHYSTPAPTVVSTLQPAISTGAQYTYQKTSVPLQPIHYSTPAPSVAVEYSTPRPFARPVIPTVLKTPVVPLSPIQYPTTVAPTEIHYTTPKPVSVVQPVSYTFQKPTVQYSTPAPAVTFEYSTPRPFVRPVPHVVQPVHHVVQPVQPVVQPVHRVVQPVQPVVQPFQHVVQPVHRVVQPLQPVVQPVQHVVQPVHRIVQPVQPVVQPFHRIVQPVQPVVQPVQHIVQPVQPVVQPVQHLVQPISYSYRKPVVPAVLKTPVVPLNPVQYSTTVAPFDLHYSTPSPVPVVQPVSPVTYTYQKPVVPLKPITYTTPAPAVSLEYSTPRPFVKTFQPFVSYSYQKPVVPTVLKTPVVPLNTIQYSTTVAPEIDLHYSTPKIPVVQPVSYTYQKPVLPLKPIQYAAPAPAVPVTYSTPRPILQPLQPAVSYTYQKPVIPTVYKTPIVPLNPVQYSTTVAPFDIHYSTPKPVPVVHPLPSVSYTYKKPVVPVTYTTPAPTVDFEYSAPKIYGQSVQSFGGYYYQKPVIPTVLKTPVVPLNTIQYSTTVAPAVDLHYSTPKPVPVVQPVSPVTYTYQKPLKPIVYTTPAPVPVSVEYSTPKPFVQPVQPVFSYSYQKPVVPTVYKTPVVPLNPVQYSTTVAPVDIHYSTPKPVPVVHPLPSVSYTYQKPVVPVQPITYTTPAPAIAVQPEQPVVGYSYPKPALSYSYPKPVIPTVFKTPVVPLNTIQYSTTVAPAVDLHYYTPKPVPVVQPVSPLTYTYQKPVVPLKPILYTTPAPAVSLEYATPRPYVQPVVSYQKPVIPTVLKTPVVPLNTIQYSTTVAPAVDLHYSVPQPAVTYTYQKPSFRVRPQVPVVPTVLKTPAVPLSPIQYTTPAPVLDYSYQGPVISSVKFGHGYERPLVYSTPKPAVAVTPTVVTSTTVVPDVHYTPMYQRVIDAFKTPVVSAYEKVLNVISGTSTPAPIVTHSPVSYAPVDVGYSYKKPAVVKTPSIPVTPVTVVPAYQKVLNVVKATTTPAPVYVNHYTSTTPVPDLVSYHEEEGTGFGIDQQDYQAQLDLYQSLKSEFGSKLQTYQHTSNEFQGHAYERPQVRFEEGAVYQKNIVPQYYQSTTTVAPVVAVKQGYDAGASLGGYKQDVYYSVQKPVLPVVKQYQHTSNEFQGYAYERPQVRFEEGAVYQKNIVPQYYQSTTTVAPVVAVKQGYDAGASLGGYKQDVYYSVQKPVLPVVKQYLQEVVPTTVVSSTPIPDFDVTTARVSLPVVKKVNLRPYVTTTTAYPTTVFTPSTAFTPSYYTSTPAPAVTISTAAPHPDDVVDVEGEEGYEENEGALLEAYNGHFGGLLSKGAVETHLAAGVSSTVASIADGETIVGVLKKGKITYNGKRTKSKVVVVSRLSDFNPILVGKLGAECSCRSNTLNLRRGKVLPSNNELFAPNTYGDDYSASGLPELSNTYLPSTTTVSPLPVVSLGDDDLGDKLGLHANVDPVVEIRPSGKLVTTTTVLPSVVNGDPYSKVTVVPTVAYEQPSSYVPVSYVTDRTPRPTYQDVLLGSSISAAEIDGEARVRPGKAFDRYGPGGWRSLDETLQGSVDCKRAGLFRHPKYCNKFYACNWDQWKGRFTLHVFNCPVHLAYDQKIGACNWPSKGPACADDNLLV